jgi:hypothetical protein
VRYVFTSVYDFLCRHLSNLRYYYLSLVTFGAWSSLGQFVLDQSDLIQGEKERADRLEYRLDGLMRFLEQTMGDLVIPSDIEPPRATTFGQGLPIEEETERFKMDIDRIRREVASGPCPDCEGKCLITREVIFQGKTVVNPLVPENGNLTETIRCPKCKGTGIAAYSES